MEVRSAALGMVAVLAGLMDIAEALDQRQPDVDADR